jgi:hypothetical protein
MAVTSDSLQRELEELVLEQIYALKQTSAMSDRDILEFHLRHYQIVMLYRRLDRNATVGRSRTADFPEDVNRVGNSV